MFFERRQKAGGVNQETALFVFRGNWTVTNLDVKEYQPTPLNDL
jgi:hypothetical protein